MVQWRSEQTPVVVSVVPNDEVDCSCKWGVDPSELYRIRWSDNPSLEKSRMAAVFRLDPEVHLTMYTYPPCEMSRSAK